MANGNINLYEAHMVSILSANALLKSNPVSLVRSQSLCVTTGNVLHIRTLSKPYSSVKEEDRTPQSVFEFDHAIDAIGWTADETILVAGDRQGVIHFVNPFLQRVIFSQDVLVHASNGDDQVSKKTFLSIQFLQFPSESCNSTLLLLCSSGLVFMFQNLPLQKLAVLMNDTQFITQLKNQTKLTKLDMSSEHNIYSSFLLPITTPTGYSNGMIISAGRGKCGLCVWGINSKDEFEVQDCISYILRDTGISRCDVTQDGKYLVTLSESDTLAVWILSSLVMINLWTSGAVKDFSLCQVATGVSALNNSKANSSMNGCSDRLCLITEDTTGKRSLVIATLPGFQFVYSMDVSTSAFLFQGQVTEDSLYFVDVEADQDTDVQRLLVKHLVQALPENRLSTLLAQERFQEAEAIAKRFNLDAELVHKTKARVFNNLWIDKTLSGEDVTDIHSNLVQCLDQLQDVVFLTDLILNSPYPTVEMILEGLHIAKGKLSRYSSKETYIKSAQAKVFVALNKLVTFQMVQTGNSFSSEQWRSFLAGSLLEELKSHLKTGDLRCAEAIWNRHNGIVVAEVGGPELLSLVRCIPESVPSAEMCLWLSRSIVPFILQHTMQSLDEFLLWVQERVRLLELLEKEQWPMNGVRTCDCILDTISSFRNPMAKMALQASAVSRIDIMNENQSCLSALRDLQEKLNDICFIQSTLQCSISLSEYEKETQELVVFRLLDRVIAAELVTTTIDHKVLPYIDRHKLNLDSLLLNYIKLFLSHSPRFSSGLTDSPHEAKAIALTQAIKDKELHVLGCIEFLKHVHIPWSEAVEELVQGCLKVDHPCVSTLEKQYKLLQLRKVLYDYGIRNVNFSDTSYGWLYIRRILSSSGPSVLVDALQLASMYQLSASDVYKYHIINLGAMDKINVASEVLRALDKKECSATAQKIFEFASNKLHLPFKPHLDDPVDYKVATELALVCLSAFKQVQSGEVECCLYEDWLNVETAVSLYKRLLALQVEYSIFVSPGELSDRMRCEQLFEEKVEEYTRDLCSSQSSSAKNCHTAKRYCYLIGFSEEQFFEAVAMSCARRNEMKPAKKLCWDLVESNPNACPAYLLLRTVQYGWALVKSDPDKVSKKDIEDLKELAAQAVAVCSRGLLIDALEIYSLCSLLSALHSQSEELEIGEGENDVSSGEDSLFDNWVWSPRFKEDGLVLDHLSILSAAIMYADSRAPMLSAAATMLTSAAFSSERDSMQLVLNLSSQLCHLLQDNGHNQLALLCSLQTLSSFYQHATVMSVADRSSSTGKKTDKSYPVLKRGQKYVSELMVQLIGKVLSSRRLDHDYALSLLLMVSPQIAGQKLQGVRSKSISSYSRVISLCDLAVDYCYIAKQPALKDLSLSIRNSAEWGKKLSKVKISYTEAFRGGQEEKKRVATALFRSKEADVEIILHYCNEVLELRSQSVLLKYLVVILTEWEEPKESLERAAVILPLIKDQPLVHEQLAHLLSNKISPYDYERIEFALQHLEGEKQHETLQIDQGLLLLKCLRCYNRSAAPADFEKRWYLHKHMQSTDPLELDQVVLPDQSSSRLPFHPILYDSPMEIIGQELSDTTITKLEPIATILMLNGDNFCSVAIKNIASCDVTSAGSPKPGLTITQFGSVTDLLHRIQDMNLALSISKWLAKQLQTCEERVMALKTAVSISSTWKEQAQTKTELKSANEKLSMFTKLLRITQTDQLLHRYKLDEPSFLNLSSQGATLIMQLYTEIPVSKRQPVPAVHSLANEIAQVNHIKLDKIKSKLTEQWLLSTKSDSNDMDVTQMSMMEDPTEEAYDADKESEDELNFKRLKYLLNVPEKLEANSSMLLHWAKRTSSSTGSLSRVKALQVLFSICPDTLIEKISGTSTGEVRDFMQSALFTSELERLHISTSVPAFQACNKEGLMKSLWKNHSQEPRALRLICELCLHYTVCDGNLWSKLLHQLLTLGMLSYMRHVLRALAVNPDQLWNIPSLPMVWQEMLLHPFRDATPPLSVFQEEECVESLRMLLECPCPYELDIPQIAKGFADACLMGHALIAVLVLPTEGQRQGLAQTLLEKMTPKQVDTFLSDLSDPPKSSVLITYKREIQELIFSYVNWNDKHAMLVSSQHFTSYVHFLVLRKNIDRLLVKTLQANRVAEAIKLVELYTQYHKSSNLSEMDLLKEFLSVRNITCFKESLELMTL